VKVIDMNDNLMFGDEGPLAQQMHSDEIGKIVRYTIEMGQELDETHAPFIPRYFLVLKGEGLFVSENGHEQRCGPGTMVVFAPKEDNTIKADSEQLVVVGFLYWATGG